MVSLNVFSGMFLVPTEEKELFPLTDPGHTHTQRETNGSCYHLMLFRGRCGQRGFVLGCVGRREVDGETLVLCHV